MRAPRWGRGPGRVVALVALACLTAACGSATVSTTTSGGTTELGPLVAELYHACSARFGTVVDRAPTGGHPTPDAALSAFLASGAADKVRGERFEPAEAPSGFGPVQSVVANATSTPLTTSITAGPAPRWYAHRDAQGRVTLVIAMSWNAGWAVDQLSGCTPGREIQAPTETTFAATTSTA